LGLCVGCSDDNSGSKDAGDVVVGGAPDTLFAKQLETAIVDSTFAMGDPAFVYGSELASLDTDDQAKLRDAYAGGRPVVVLMADQDAVDALLPIIDGPREHELVFLPGDSPLRTAVGFDTESNGTARYELRGVLGNNVGTSRAVEAVLDWVGDDGHHIPGANDQLLSDDETIDLWSKAKRHKTTTQNSGMTTSVWGSTYSVTVYNCDDGDFWTAVSLSMGSASSLG